MHSFPLGFEAEPGAPLAADADPFVIHIDAALAQKKAMGGTLGNTASLEVGRVQVQRHPASSSDGE